MHHQKDGLTGTQSAFATDLFKKMTPSRKIPMNTWRRPAVFAAILLAAFLFGALIASASWSNPDYLPSKILYNAPINTLSSQIKFGGLELNNALGIKNALLVLTGKVVFGPQGFTPTDEFSLTGNLNISGLINPNTKSGTAGNGPTAAITRTGNSVAWKGRGWMTIMGDWSNDPICSGSYPASCAANPGYKDFGLYCLADPLIGYSVWVRVCRE